MLSDYIDGHSKQSMEQRDKDRVLFLKNFQNLIYKYDHIVIFSHEKSDGDSLGSSFGLQEIIRSNFPKKKAYVVGSSFGLFPWMNMKFDDVINYNFPFENALALIVDVGQSQRIQSFEKFFKNSKVNFGAIVKIDHHGCPSDFHIDLSWDDPTYVATCCQIIQLADFYGWKLTPRAANFLYLGLCTDSLRFSVDSTLPRSLILAAKAWRAGADYVNIHRKLRTRTWEDIEFHNHVFSKCQKTENIIWSEVTLDDLAKFNRNNIGGAIDLFRDIEDLWYWFIFTEKEDGTYDVSIRSSWASARELAIKFGGGGHDKASGCRISKDQKEEFIRVADEMAAHAKQTIEREKFEAGEDSYEVELIKHNILKDAPKDVEDAKDLLRGIKRSKKSNWEEE